MSYEKWIDELQAAVDNISKRVASAVASAFKPTITDPTDGQALLYDAESEAFVNASLPAAPSMSALVTEGTAIATYTAGEDSVTLYAPGSNEEWEVLAYNASGFAISTDPIYTCPAGTSLSDFSEIAILQYFANTNVAQGKSLIHRFVPEIYQKLAAVTTEQSTTPFSAYSKPIVYAFYTNQRYGYELDFTNGTIKQTDNASDTGSTNFRVIAVMGKRVPVVDTRLVKRRTKK